MSGILQRRDSRSPISIPSEPAWLGNDGPWGVFLIGFGGAPAQFLKILASTSNPHSYVILPEGCLAGDNFDCPTARGSLFYTNRSATWSNLGDFTLESHRNLGIDAYGDFFYDNITLGPPGTGAPPTLPGQIIAGITGKDFFIGSLGLRPAPTNLTNFDNPIPSLLQTLKSAQYIPSLAYGYTAGSYHISTVNKYGQGSLTIGGYDKSRFTESGSTFHFADDMSRDLVAGILSIETDGSRPLLASPILAFLDSTVSHVWLPLSACQRFESAFNLTYDSNLDLYLVNETVHEALLARNPTISFILNNNLSVTSTSIPVTVNLPYSAFDLRLTRNYPNNRNNATYYFPLRRAANETQYTLGRTFFQHAYVIADYERSTFSVHQATFPVDAAAPDLQAIWPVSPGDQTKLQTGAITGITIGACAAISMILAVLYWWHRTRHRKLTNAMATVILREAELESSEKAVENPELGAMEPPVLELHPNSQYFARELPNDVPVNELYAAHCESAHMRQELPG